VYELLLSSLASLPLALVGLDPLCWFLIFFLLLLLLCLCPRPRLPLLPIDLSLLCAH
jgi:hypothetical protein